MRKSIKEALAKKHQESYDRTEPDPVYVGDTPQWSLGDIPITWHPDELKRLHKKTLRDNYKRGAISRDVYIKMLRG